MNPIECNVEQVAGIGLCVGQPRPLWSWLSWDQHLHLHSSEPIRQVTSGDSELSGFNLKLHWLHVRVFLTLQSPPEVDSSETTQVCIGVLRRYLQAARNGSTGFTWQLTSRSDKNGCTAATGKSRLLLPTFKTYLYTLKRAYPVDRQITSIGYSYPNRLLQWCQRATAGWSSALLTQWQLTSRCMKSEQQLWPETGFEAATRKTGLSGPARLLHPALGDSYLSTMEGGRVTTGQ